MESGLLIRLAIGLKKLRSDSDKRVIKAYADILWSPDASIESTRPQAWP